MKVKFIKIIHEARICIPHVTNEEYAKIKLVIFKEKERALYLQNNSNPSKIVILTFANPNQFSINFVVQDLNAVDLTFVIIVNNSTKIV